MVYAKLYPAELIEGYRKALRGAYVTAHAPDSLKPTAGAAPTFRRMLATPDC